MDLNAMSPDELNALYYNTPSSEFGPEASGMDPVYPQEPVWGAPAQEQYAAPPAAPPQPQQQAPQPPVAYQQQQPPPQPPHPAQQQAAWAQQQAYQAQRAYHEQQARLQHAQQAAAYARRLELQRQQDLSGVLGESRHEPMPPSAPLPNSGLSRGLMWGALFGGALVAGAWYLGRNKAR